MKITVNRSSNGVLAAAFRFIELELFFFVLALMRFLTYLSSLLTSLPREGWLSSSFAFLSHSHIQFYMEMILCKIARNLNSFLLFLRHLTIVEHFRWRKIAIAIIEFSIKFQRGGDSLCSLSVDHFSVVL